MKFDPHLNSVRATCTKPTCAGTFLHRHHIKHEALWLWLREADNRHKDWTDELVKDMNMRYHEFRKEDIVVVCSWHHAEIHMLYINILENNQRRKCYKALADYSFKEAQTLMRHFEKACQKWLTKVTPGIDPESLDGMRSFPHKKRKKVG